MTRDEGEFFLGLDFSTQQLKGTVVGEELEILFEESVEFDTVLPEFRTQKGIIYNAQNKTATSPTVMWVKALDMLLDKLQVSGADLGKVIAVSGSAQQHGTVYWQKGAEKVLKNLDPSSFLHTQLATCFSVLESPIWMDSSTTEYCRKLEDIVGGPQKLAEITGSRAYERFSGPQIAKIANSRRSAYDNTERISLVSSFACSLFLGRYAPIDLADGSGTNLLDIRKKNWCQLCLDACAPDLANKLGKPVPSGTDLGVVSEYFVDRFGFNSNCHVICFTGDNPASLIGLQLCPSDIGISLGTSDTLFLWLHEPISLLEGHILVNPVDADHFMALLCFKNGSFVRERFRDLYAKGDWDEFGRVLMSTPSGNYGYFGLFYDFHEIIPFISGVYRFDENNRPVSKFPAPEIELRALVEGQMVAKRAHAEDCGFVADSGTRILATGGASKSKELLQVMSNVFNAPVYKQSIQNSAALGAAYLACFGYNLEKTLKEHHHMTNVEIFRKMVSSAHSIELVCEPEEGSEEVYSSLVSRYRELVKTILESK